MWCDHIRTDNLKTLKILILILRILKILTRTIWRYSMWLGSSTGLEQISFHFRSQECQERWGKNSSILNSKSWASCAFSNALSNSISTHCYRGQMAWLSWTDLALKCKMSGVPGNLRHERLSLFWKISSYRQSHHPDRNQHHQLHHHDH